MNKAEKKTAHKIARIMRAVRKQKGLNQTSVAKFLEISQGALSKYESGSMIPSAHHWVEFCNFTQIPANSYLEGFVDHKKPVYRSNLERIGNFKIPKQYSHDCASTVRTTVPFFKFVEDQLGAKYLADYLESIKMDPDFFVIMDNPFNINFNLDLARHLISKGKLKNKDLPTLLKPVMDSSTHGKIHEAYAHLKDPLMFVETAVANASYYDTNSKYEIQEKSKNKLILSVTPEDHMKQFSYKDSTLEDFLCRYKKNWFESISRYGNSSASTQIQELQCHFSGASKCVYQVSLNH